MTDTEIDEQVSERQRESLSLKPVSLGGIVLSCAFLGDYGSLSPLALPSLNNISLHEKRQKVL